MLNSHLKAYVIQYTTTTTTKTLVKRSKKTQNYLATRYVQHDRIIFCTPRKVEYISLPAKNSNFRVCCYNSKLNITSIQSVEAMQIAYFSCYYTWVKSLLRAKRGSREGGSYMVCAANKQSLPKEGLKTESSFYLFCFLQPSQI